MLTSAKWQERRDALGAVGSGGLSVGGAELAKALEKETNAAVFDAGLEAVAAWVARDDAGLGDAIDAGLLVPVVARGVASTRGATARKGRALLDSIWASAKGPVFAALLDGARGKSKAAATCASTLADYVAKAGGWDALKPSIATAASQVETAVQGMFDAAAPEIRTAAAALVVALGGAFGTHLEEGLKPQTKKLVEKARQEPALPGKKATKEPLPPPPLDTPPQVVVAPSAPPPPVEEEAPPPSSSPPLAATTVVAEPLVPLSLSAASDENKENPESWRVPLNINNSGNNKNTNSNNKNSAATVSGKKRPLAEVLSALEEKSVAPPYDGSGVFFAAATKWLERKEAVDVVGQLVGAAEPPATAEDADRVVDLAEALARVAKGETHAKVAASAIGAVGVLAEYLRQSPQASASAVAAVAAVVPRLKDKRFAAPVSATLATLARCDAKLLADEAVHATLTAALDKKDDPARRLNPSGRATLFDWVATSVPRSKFPQATCAHLATLALADVADASAELRTAALAALAALVARSSAPLKGLDHLDARVKKRLDDLVAKQAPEASKADATVTAGKNKPRPLTAAPSSKQPTSSSSRPSYSAAPPPPETQPAAAIIMPRRRPSTTAPAPPAISARPLLRGGRGAAAAEEAPASEEAIAEVVSTAVRKALAETMDKESWKRRKQALETIIEACQGATRVGATVLDGAPTRALLKDLKPRLSDANAKLRPLACEALTALLTAVAPKASALRLGKQAVKATLGAVLDMSRGVREKAFEALGACLGEFGGSAEPNSRAFSDAVPLIGEALLSASAPAAKPALVAWLELRAAKTTADDAEPHLVPPLLTLLRDKAAPTRDCARSCLVEYWRRGCLTEEGVDFALRDLAPAAKRALVPVLDAIFGEAQMVAPSDHHPEGDADDGFQALEAEMAQHQKAAENVGFAEQAPPVTAKQQQQQPRVIVERSAQRSTNGDGASTATATTLPRAKGSHTTRGAAKNKAASSPPPPCESLSPSAFEETDDDFEGIEAPAAFDFSHVGGGGGADKGVLFSSSEGGLSKMMMMEASKGGAGIDVEAQLKTFASRGADAEMLWLALHKCEQTPRPDLVQLLVRVVEVGLRKLAHDDAAFELALLALRALEAALRPQEDAGAAVLITVQDATVVLRVATRKAVEPYLDDTLAPDRRRREERRRVRIALNALYLRLKPRTAETLCAALVLLKDSATARPTEHEDLVCAQLASVVYEARRPTAAALPHAHALVDAVRADEPHLALDAARTVLVRLLDVMGLDALLKAAADLDVPQESPLLNLARLLGSDHPSAENSQNNQGGGSTAGVVVAGPPPAPGAAETTTAPAKSSAPPTTAPAAAKAPPPLPTGVEATPTLAQAAADETTATRLEAAKARLEGTRQAQPPPTFDPNKSNPNTIVDRINQLRQRLATTRAP